MQNDPDLHQNPPLRGRPPREEALRRRQHLLETALALFMENGLSVSMHTIAIRARVSKRTLYARYPDKMALFMGVLEWLSSVDTSLPLDLPPDQPLIPTLIRYGEALFAYYSNSHLIAFLRLMEKERERIPDLERVVSEKVVHELVMPLLHYLEAQPAGLLREVDLFVAARMHFRNIALEIGGAISQGHLPDVTASSHFLEQSSTILAAGLLQRDINLGAA